MSALSLAIALFFGPSITAPAGIEYQQLVSEANAKRVGEPAKAVELYARALKLSEYSGDVWWRYGQTLLSQNKHPEAIDALKKAIRYGAFGNRFVAGAEYDIACAYAKDGKIEPAFQALQDSLSHGWRDMEHLRTDADLNSLHKDPRWEELAAIKDVTKMSRDEGWRYDLWFFDREARRKHFNPYHLHPKEEFDALYKKLHDGIPTMSDNQIRVELLRYASMLGDGHTHIRPAAPLTLPIQAFWFQEGVFITAASKDNASLAGAQVLEVEGRTIGEVYDQVYALIPKDNEQNARALVGRYALNPMLLNGLGLAKSETELAVTFKLPNGETKTITLKAGTEQPTPDWITARATSKTPDPLYLKNRPKAHWLEYLADSKTLYAQYNSVRNETGQTTEQFARLITEAVEKNDVKSIVMDIRWNGGGNSFLNRPILHSLIRVKPGRDLFVIIGRNTFSAAMNFTVDMARELDPVFVGEPTGSSPAFIGESVPFVLPYSKMQGTISDLFWQRGWPMDERKWIAPDLPAPPVFELYKDNRDPAMETILAYLKSRGG